MNTITLHLTDSQMADLQAAADRRTMSVEETVEVWVAHELWLEAR